MKHEFKNASHGWINRSGIFYLICQDTCLIMWSKSRPLALYLWPYDPLIKWTIHLIRLRVRSGPRPTCSGTVYFQLAFSLPADSSRRSLATCHPVPVLPATHGNRSTQAPVAMATTCSCFVSGGWWNLATQTADKIQQRDRSQANTIKIKDRVRKGEKINKMKLGCVSERYFWLRTGNDAVWKGIFKEETKFD